MIIPILETQTSGVFKGLGYFIFDHEWGQEYNPAGSCWHPSSALKPSQARLIPATTFELVCFIPALLGFSQTPSDPNQSGCFLLDSDAAALTSPPTLVWFSGEQRGRKNGICSSTVNHEQNKSQPSPSCKVSMFGRKSKERWEKKHMDLNKCFYEAEARTALQTPGWDLTSQCSVK